MHLICSAAGRHVCGIVPFRAFPDIAPVLRLCGDTVTSLQSKINKYMDYDRSWYVSANVQPAAVHVRVRVLARTTTYRRPKGQSRGSASSDVILITMRAPRAFCAVGRSTGWEGPPV